MSEYCKHRISSGCKKTGKPCNFSDSCREPEEQKAVELITYSNMPKVNVNDKLYVDKKIFVDYAINLLQQDIDNCFNEDEKHGIEFAIQRLLSI